MSGPVAQAYNSRALQLVLAVCEFAASLGCIQDHVYKKVTVHHNGAIMKILSLMRRWLTISTNEEVPELTHRDYGKGSELT